MAKFLNLHCLETNVIEGTVQFDLAVSFSFIQHRVPESLTHITGYKAELVNLSNPIGGAVQNRADALSILRDTHKVTNPCLLCFLGYC
jgi:hypothetical protein